MENNGIEFGVEFRDEHGNNRTDWGWGKMPTPDRDGWINLGKHDWVEALRILRRPLVEETVVWEASS